MKLALFEHFILLKFSFGNRMFLKCLNFSHSTFHCGEDSHRVKFRVNNSHSHSFFSFFLCHSFSYFFLSLTLSLLSFCLSHSLLSVSLFLFLLSLSFFTLWQYLYLPISFSFCSFWQYLSLCFSFLLSSIALFCQSLSFLSVNRVLFMSACLFSLLVCPFFHLSIYFSVNDYTFLSLF